MAATVVPAARLGVHVGHGVGRLGVDTALARLRSFPRRVADLTPQALSRLMGRTVDAVSVIDGEAGTSSRARLALTGDGNRCSSLQAATAATRMLGELARLGETEARFYSRPAPALATAFHGRTVRHSTRSRAVLIVLEDMATSLCQFPDTLNLLDVDQMALLMEVLAHARRLLGQVARKTGGGGESAG
jgi:hypothetical protein